MSTEDEFNTGVILSQTQNDDSIPVKKGICGRHRPP